MIASPMPMTYQSAPAMQAHMNTPSTNTAPCSLCRTVSLDSRVVITGSLIGIDGLCLYRAHRNGEFHSVGSVGETEGHRARNAVGDADATLGLDLDPHPHFAHPTVVHRRKAESSGSARPSRAIFCREHHVHVVHEAVENQRGHAE